MKQAAGGTGRSEKADKEGGIPPTGVSVPRELGLPHLLCFQA